MNPSTFFSVNVRVCPMVKATNVTAKAKWTPHQLVNRGEFQYISHLSFVSSFVVGYLWDRVEKANNPLR